MKRRTSISFILLFLLCIGSSATGSAQQPRTSFLRFTTSGQPDATFDGDGERLVTTVPANVYPYDFAQTAAGKLVVAYQVDGFGGDFVVGRHNADGTPDTSFSTDGFQSVGAGTAYAVASHGTGTFAVGQVGGSPVVVRFNNSGALDTSFGGTGIVALAVPSWSIGLSSVAVIPSSGKVVVGGYAYAAQNDIRFFAAQLTPTGALDPTFSGDGVSVIAFPGMITATARALHVHEATPGAAVIALGGNVRNAILGPFQMGIMLLGANGAPLSSFSGDGARTVTFQGSQEHDLTAIAVDAQGRVIIGGNAFIPSEQYAIARFRADGDVDKAFSGDGRVTVPFTAEGLNRAWLQDLKVDASGGVIAVGMGTASPGPMFATLASITSVGALNTGFAGDGRATYDSPNTVYSSVRGVVLDSLGRIVAVGAALIP